MFAHDRTIRFRDFSEFYDAINERRAPFAAIRSDAYQISSDAKINLIEIQPATDIHIAGEFDENHFEVTYCLSGCLVIDDKHYGWRAFQANQLSVTQKLRSSASLIFRGGQPFRGIIFESARETLSSVLGDECAWLWDETALPGDPCERADMYLGRAAPSDIMSAFFQISGCDYPPKIKRPFVRNKIVEILLRIAARGLPPDKSRSRLGEFETERIKRIPGILMERIDSPPTIREIARELSLNSTAMKKGFTEIFGAPIYAHHRNLCLELAAGMLLDTKKAVAEIAIDTGYSGSASFCNAFKKRYRVSPNQYRRKGEPRQ
ncbi:MAG: AraC family transcriptional regulator [Synergistaceae bacterium]|nr:AraC family transcriptional regulator [Synergistaceae bacterium]